MQVNLLVPGFLCHLIITQYIMTFSLTHLTLFILLVIIFVILIKYSLIKKDNKLLSEKLYEANNIIEKQKKKLKEITVRHNEINNFKKSIDRAELTTMFQSSRLKTAHSIRSQTGSFNVPEKYSYIRSLTEKGMTPDEIATLLSISRQEASQLVTLTMINPAK